MFIATRRRRRLNSVEYENIDFAFSAFFSLDYVCLLFYHAYEFSRSKPYSARDRFRLQSWARRSDGRNYGVQSISLRFFTDTVILRRAVLSGRHLVRVVFEQTIREGKMFRQRARAFIKRARSKFFHVKNDRFVSYLIDFYDIALGVYARRRSVVKGVWVL